MDKKSAQYYDAVYQFKDYAGEAGAIAELISREVPGARRVLNVTCGAHEHVRTLKTHFRVDGVDIMDPFLEIARAKNPDGRYVQADMRDFDMGATYDAVLCLFSAIGYMLTPEDLDRALANFVRHVKLGGLIGVEPSFASNRWQEGKPFMRVVDTDDLKIARLNTSKIEGPISVMDLYYLVADGTGVSYFVEEHRTRLYSRAEMEAAFRNCGEPVTYLPDWAGGRGLYINRYNVTSPRTSCADCTIARCSAS